MSDEKEPQQPENPGNTPSGEQPGFIVPPQSPPPSEPSAATPPPSPPPASGQASSRATLALILGIVGIVLCPPVAVAAWIIGVQERRAIAAGQSPQAGQGMATAGWVMGIIGTIILILIVLIVGFAIAAATIMGGSRFSQIGY